MKTRIVVMTLLLASLGVATAQAHDGYRHEGRWDRGALVGRGPWRHEGPRFGWREPFLRLYAPALWIPPLPVVVYPPDGALALNLHLPLR